MKKFFFVAVVASFAVACNNSSSTEATKDSVGVKTDTTVKTTIDTTGVKTDTTVKTQVDTVKKDTTKK